MKRSHDTNSSDCWCRPRLERPCRSCRGMGYEPGQSKVYLCWRCGGAGMVKAHPEESGILVIHNDPPEEPGLAAQGAAAAKRVLLLAGVLGFVIFGAAVWAFAVKFLGWSWPR